MGAAKTTTDAAPPAITSMLFLPGATLAVGGGSGKPLRGFDRLTAAGFSEEDIANVRRQFHGSRLPGTTDGEDGAVGVALVTGFASEVRLIESSSCVSVFSSSWRGLA